MLPVYPAPQQGEVLSSWLLRLGAANHLRPMRLTKLLGIRDAWRRDLDVSLAGHELALLSSATGVPESRLRDCMVLPLLEELHEAPDAAASPRFLVMSGKHAGLKVVRGHPVCPDCLRETGGAHRFWRLTTTVVCERHQRLLVDRCGVCGAPTHPARYHLRLDHRLKTVTQAPHLCGECRAPLGSGETLSPDDLRAALHLQDLMRQAVEHGVVQWSGLRIPAREWQYVVESITQLYYPSKAASGQAKWRPETVSLADRLPVMLAAGHDLRLPIINLLWAWRERGLLPGDITLWWRQSHLPGLAWWGDLVDVALYRDSKFLKPPEKPVTPFRFGQHEWEVIEDRVPALRSMPRHGRRLPVRDVLEAWCTRNIYLIRQQDWQTSWTGVSYPALNRRINALAGAGILDDVLTVIRHELPACAAHLTTPETVYSLERLGSCHSHQFWTEIVEKKLKMQR